MKTQRKVPSLSIQRPQVQSIAAGPYPIVNIQSGIFHQDALSSKSKENANDQTVPVVIPTGKHNTHSSHSTALRNQTADYRVPEPESPH